MPTSEKILEEKRKRMMHLMVSDINEEEKKEFEELISNKELMEYTKKYSLEWLEGLRTTNRLSEENRKRIDEK